MVKREGFRITYVWRTYEYGRLALLYRPQDRGRSVLAQLIVRNGPALLRDMRSGTTRNSLRVMVCISALVSLLARARTTLVKVKQAELASAEQRDRERSYILRRNGHCRAVIRYAIARRDEQVRTEAVRAETFAEQRLISEHSAIVDLVAQLLAEEAEPLFEAHKAAEVSPTLVREDQAPENVPEEEGEISDFVFGVAAVWRAINIRAWILRGQYNYRTRKLAQQRLAEMNDVAARASDDVGDTSGRQPSEAATFGHHFSCFPALGICNCDAHAVSAGAPAVEVMTDEQVCKKCEIITAQVFERNGRANVSIKVVPPMFARAAFEADGSDLRIWNIAVRRAGYEELIPKMRTILANSTG
ncbi:hypothetical protein [Sclerotinia sclerotiorum megabirnavirus 1]|uniref:Uncharacterized protein n=1 Tax=Sclerotinia sclerotiorum megabirnavirus 1 TaxID=1661257 RepID=A0A0G3FL62_9VIRU|nr:hypothetical protein [Sclerotinia sclerotiorum megabirnavirus 1]AKJ87317.1 hypothetical protein [Sclerotinia sclerotiorum megabirnavirus 1]